MPQVCVIAKPDLAGKRLAFALAEERLGHSPEVPRLFSRIFQLHRVGPSEPASLRAPSGASDALVFIGRSGEPFPSGLEIYALIAALEPWDDKIVDRDLWAILRWMIDGVGAPWSLADLDATGKLYRIPACV